MDVNGSEGTTLYLQCGVVSNPLHFVLTRAVSWGIESGRLLKYLARLWTKSTWTMPQLEASVIRSPERPMSDTGIVKLKDPWARFGWTAHDVNNILGTTTLRCVMDFTALAGVKDTLSDEWTITSLILLQKI